MSPVELLLDLARHDAWLEVRGDRLRYRGPEQLLTLELKKAVDDRRAELIAWLSRTATEIPAEDLAALDYDPISDDSQRGGHVDELTWRIDVRAADEILRTAERGTVPETARKGSPPPRSDTPHESRRSRRSRSSTATSTSSDPDLFPTGGES